MRTHAGCIFDLLTSGSVHVEVLPWTICLPTLVFIAQAIFVLERGQTDEQTNKQTRLNALPHAGVCNNQKTEFITRDPAASARPEHEDQDRIFWIEIVLRPRARPQDHMGLRNLIIAHQYICPLAVYS